MVTLGQDGLVANTLKYLNGQPVVGVNPDPERWDGRLLPFRVSDLSKLMPEVVLRKRPHAFSDHGQGGVEQWPDLVWRERPVHRTEDALLGPISHPQR